MTKRIILLNVFLCIFINILAQQSLQKSHSQQAIKDAIALINNEINIQEKELLTNSKKALQKLRDTASERAEKEDVVKQSLRERSQMMRETYFGSSYSKGIIYSIIERLLQETDAQIIFSSSRNLLQEIANLMDNDDNYKKTMNDLSDNLKKIDDYIDIITGKSLNDSFDDDDWDDLSYLFNENPHPNDYGNKHPSNNRFDDDDSDWDDHFSHPSQNSHPNDHNNKYSLDEDPLDKHSSDNNALLSNLKTRLQQATTITNRANNVTSSEAMLSTLIADIDSLLPSPTNKSTITDKTTISELRNIQSEAGAILANLQGPRLRQKYNVSTPSPQ
jgi:hypothetical protein